MASDINFALIAVDLLEESATDGCAYARELLEALARKLEDAESVMRAVAPSDESS